MKKSLVYFAAFAALLAFWACNKVQEADVAAAEEGFRTVTITAGLEAVKTSYGEDGKFNWVDGDKIGVIVKNEDGAYQQITFETRDNGSSAKFTGQVPSGYYLTGEATYPFFGGSNDFIYDYEGSPRAEENTKFDSFRIYGSIFPGTENPRGFFPLFGKADAAGNYQFTSAAGAVKFSFDNLPSKTRGLMLNSGDSKAAPLNGWFNLDENGVIRMENAVSGYADRYCWLSEELEEGGSYDFYFFLPVGTLPAGLSVNIVPDDYIHPLFTFVTAQEIQVQRNRVTNVSALMIPDPVESLTLDESSVTLSLLEQHTLKAVIKPDTAAGQAVQWSSSNEEVAYVDNLGNVTALGVGSAVITGSCDEKSVSCTVVVLPLNVSVQDNLFTEWKVGDQIGVIVKNEDGAYAQVPFSAANAGATAFFKGSIPYGYTSFSGVATYPFTGSKNDLDFDCDGNPHVSGDSKFNNTYRLYGSLYPSEEAPLSTLPLVGQLDKDNIFQFKAAAAAVKFTIQNTPEGMTGLRLVSSNDANPLNGWFNLADDGTIRMANAVDPWGDRYCWPATTIQKGETRDFYFFLPLGTLPAGTQVGVLTDAFWDTWTPLFTFATDADIDLVTGKLIEVPAIQAPYQVEGLSLEESALTLSILEQHTLKPVITPSGAAGRPIQWTSSDEEVAYVDDDGKIIALGVGSAVITGSCEGFTVSCTVTVQPLSATVTDNLFPGWAVDDQIGVIVTNEDGAYAQVAFKAAGAGTSVSFNGKIPHGYTSFTGIATYPFAGGSNDLIYEYKDSPRAQSENYGSYRLYGSLYPSEEAPLSTLPLVGQLDQNKVFQFKAAAAAVKFTIKNAPEGMTGLRLVSSASANPLNGWFSLADDGTVQMGNAVEPWSDRYCWPATTIQKGETRDFYYFLPLGTLPAKTQAQVITDDYWTTWTPIYTFYTESSVDLVTGKLIEVPAFDVKDPRGGGENLDEPDPQDPWLNF